MIIAETFYEKKKKKIPAIFKLDDVTRNVHNVIGFFFSSFILNDAYNFIQSCGDCK